LDIVMVTDADGTIRYTTPSVERVLGYRPEEMVGTNSAEYVHPDDMERASKELEALLSKPEVHPVAVETRVRHKDGSWRHLEGIASNLLDDPAVGGLVFNQRDVTDRVRAEEEVRRLNEELEGLGSERTAQLEAALSELRSSEERYRQLVESASDYAIFTVDAEGRITNWSTGAERLFGYREEEIIGKPGSLLFTPEDIRSGAPEEELRVAAEEGRAEDERWHVRKDGSRFWASGFVRPILGEDGTLRGFAKVARDVTERKRAAEVQRFLAEAGEALSSSLDYRATLASVAHLVVPTLADWCTVDVVTEDGSVERLAVAHPDPKRVELAYELQERYPTDPDAPSGVPTVLRTGEPEMMEEIPEELIEQAARDEGHRQMLRELGLRSYMVVPLVARGRTLGAISFVSAESGRRYGPADLELARELARRAGLAVDNARLYEEAQKEIAERRWAQEELQRSREQLEVILRGVADGIVAQDPSGRLVYANETAARMSGYSSAREFVNAPVEEVMSKFELLDAKGRSFPLERLPGRRALMGEEDAEEILRFRVTETGEERWSVVRATPVFGEESGVRLAVSIMRDITEQRRAEQEQARLAAIVESSEDAIIGKTLEGIITSWNRGAERIYGYSAEEIVRRPITTLVPPERPEEIPNILKKIRRGEKVEHYDTVRVTKDGRRLNISLTVSPIRDSTGSIVGASTIARDITERKRIEGALQDMREAERRRIAHDLHDGVLQDLSYTTAALGLIMADAEGTGLEESLQRAVDALRRAAQGLRGAVNDLRLADELDQPFPRLVESLVERNSEMARGLRIELKVREEGFPSEPLGETGTQVLRIIQEALTNARRHSGAKSVVVTVGMEGNDLIAEVADDGRGFGSGVPTGVGLNSMRERAAAIGGSLEIGSEVGRGTRVFLRVPRQQKE
jgi:PAS domain S-box-containing protein